LRAVDRSGRARGNRRLRDDGGGAGGGGRIGRSTNQRGENEREENGQQVQHYFAGLWVRSGVRSAGPGLGRLILHHFSVRSSKTAWPFRAAWLS